MHAHRTRNLGLIAAIGIVAALAAGCSGTSTSKDASLASPLAGNHGPAAGAAGPISAAGPASSASTASAGAGTPASTAVDLAVAKRPGGDRQVISTAQLQLQARDVDQAVQRASKIVVNAQGYVFSESASLAGHQSATVVFKVPPAEFDNVVGGIGGLGKLVHRQIGTQDVTGEVVDLGARLSAAQTSAGRLQQLLASSGNVADLLSVEQQLTTRQGEVDSLSGELAALQAQVNLATITLDISALPDHATAPKHHHAGPGFTRGLHAGGVAFAGTARVVEATVGLTLPFAPVGLLFLAGWWFVRRRAAATPPAT